MFKGSKSETVRKAFKTIRIYSNNSNMFKQSEYVQTIRICSKMPNMLKQSEYVQKNKFETVRNAFETSKHIPNYCFKNFG